MKKLYSIVLTLIGIATHAQTPDTVNINWDQTQMISKTALTLQVVVNPLLRRGSAFHDSTFAALKALGCDYVRYVPWLPYPRLAVAELQKSSWDFNVIDPMTLDFLNATKGHSVILNFSTIPAWMYKTDKPVTYPDDPYAVFWSYTQGTQPIDTTYRQIADYYARLYSWYTKGGFTDEIGKRHESGYHYDVPYWEVLNEVDFEHNNTPETYTKLYDAVTAAIKKESPQTKFVGMALAYSDRPEWFEYFLNPKNHKPGTPLDMISYHFYATGSAEKTDVLQYTFFDQAEVFLRGVKFIESIRKRLSPKTKTTIDELGSILDNDNDVPDRKTPIPNEYWNLSGALYAYTYLALAHMGIDVVGESQLVGYPTQYPSVSMMDWKTNRPNARYWVLKLLKDNFGPGDKFVDSYLTGNNPDAPGAITIQAVATTKGKQLLLINKRNKLIKLVMPKDLIGARIKIADPSTGDQPPAESKITEAPIELKPFAVAVIIP
jgi:hypothetical protein